MLANLLSNAIDASAPGDSVSLVASSHRAGWIQFQISDRGGGIAPEHLARIFEPYFTTKEFGDDTRGFGLGLTICQKIVLLHRGTISVKSELGCGTTFTVDLPTRQEASSPTTSSSALIDPVELVR
jgi:signal transduction histidine kinase